MALQNTTDSTYLRVLIKDTAPVNLEGKTFTCEASFDQAARDDSGEWSRAKKHPQFNLSNIWTLSIVGTTTLDAIADEFYDKITDDLLNEALGTTGVWERID